MVNKKTLYRNLKYVATSQVAVIPNCSILAAVGQKMASTPGVSATLFNALAKVLYLYNSFC
jgi:aspartokinase